MANPEKVEPAFGWTSCGDGCDDGELQTWGIMPGGHWITPSVRGTGGQARIALQVMPRRDFDAPYLALLVDQNGTLLQAVKTEGMDEEKCAVAAASVWGDIFSVDMSRSGEGQIQDVFVGLLPLAGDEGIRVSSVGLRHTVPQAMTLGDEYVLWHMGFTDGISAVSIAELTEAREIIPSAVAPVFWRGIASGCGSFFLLEELAQVGEQAFPRITYTDGKSMGSAVYLSDPGVGYGAARCADSHVAFLRGSGQKDRAERFDTVEVWASPLAADPANLRPVLVDTLSGDLLVFSQGSAAGGYGRYALREDKNSLRVWDLKAGTNWSWPPTHGLEYGSVVGFTETDFWMGTRLIGASKTGSIRRYRLPAP